ncbi:MAG: GNAT family N-acetyltransferase [Candidatus Aenigmarchaeota archaeon]|nr:GNAT family N-acetyltransferase [Candidatus Aenigmarchaeota archaeon]
MPLSVFREGAAGDLLLDAYEADVRALVEANLRILGQKCVDGQPIYSSAQIEALLLHTPGDILRKAYRGTFLLSFREEDLVGAGGYLAGPDRENRTGEIICTYVHPALQGTGVFSRILLEVATLAPQDGLAFLEGDALLDPPVLAVYRHIGCEDMGEVQHQLDGVVVPRRRFRLDTADLQRTMYAHEQRRRRQAEAEALRRA